MVGRPPSPLTGYCHGCGSEGLWGLRRRVRRGGTVYAGRYCLRCDRRKAQRRRRLEQARKQNQEQPTTKAAAQVWP